jgi:hypothetical protein
MLTDTATLAVFVQLAFRPMHPLLPSVPKTFTLGDTSASVSEYHSDSAKIVEGVHHALAVT